MLSATDPIFTLQSSTEEWMNGTATGSDSKPQTVSTGANCGSGNASDVTGVCFVRDPINPLHSSSAALNGGIDDDKNECAGSESDDSSSDDDSCGPLQFQCSKLLLGKTNTHAQAKSLSITNTNDAISKSYQHAAHISAASHDSLSGAVLASCHLDGSCKLWDLATRRCIVGDIYQDGPRGGSGLAARRVGINADHGSVHQFLFQTRDPLGTVSLHDLSRPCTPLLQMHTYSTSFCAMSPCSTLNRTTMGGEEKLVALPTEEHSVAVVRDLRCDSSGNPAFRVAIGDEYISTMYGTRRKYGMLTSLALCLQETTQKIVLGCGMEDGSALFYDLGNAGHGRSPWCIGESALHSTSNGCIDSLVDPSYMCSVKLGKDPILCLDIASSHSSMDLEKETKSESLVAVGGCAGDVNELSELPEQDQGTISNIKVKLADDRNSTGMKASIRSKIRTCSIDSGGKVGVSICRFRPDGRIFAVGGWDYRLRLFSRTSSTPLAILRGHEGSVTAMDWSRNAATSGLLATGAGDGRICVYRVFPHSARELVKAKQST